MVDERMQNFALGHVDDPLIYIYHHRHYHHHHHHYYYYKHGKFKKQNSFSEKRRTSRMPDAYPLSHKKIKEKLYNCPHLLL